MAVQNPEIEEEFEVNSEEERAELEKRKKEDIKNYNSLIDGLISFDFPSTMPDNQQNLNLNNYHRLLENQSHLTPSTDVQSTALITQIIASDKEDEKSLHQLYQDLGCVGFYGIHDKDDNMISILLLNTCSDINEASTTQGLGRISCFNNVQQYIVPDVQINLLKRSLKKILRSVTKDFDIGQASRDSHDVIAGTAGSDLLGHHILKKSDFGPLLLLGKLYFHLCKFKQSVYCLNLAILKCKTQKQTNQRDLEQALLWQIFVQFVFLTNKLRVFRKNRNKNSNKNVERGTMLAGMTGRTNSINLDKLNEFMLYGAQEIFDVYRALREQIDEFYSVKMSNKQQATKNVPTVLFIKLKLEIIRQSQLFKDIIEVQVNSLDPMTPAESTPEPLDHNSMIRQGTMAFPKKNQKTAKSPALPKAKVGFLGGLFNRKDKNRKASRKRATSELNIEEVEDVEGHPSISRARLNATTLDNQSSSGSNSLETTQDANQSQEFNKRMQALNQKQNLRQSVVQRPQASLIEKNFNSRATESFLDSYSKGRMDDSKGQGRRKTLRVDTKGKKLEQKEEMLKAVENKYLKDFFNKERAIKRSTVLTHEEYMIHTCTDVQNDQILNQIVKAIAQVDSYIGAVAQAEVHFFQLLGRGQDKEAQELFAELEDIKEVEETRQTEQDDISLQNMFIHREDVARKSSVSGVNNLTRGYKYMEKGISVLASLTNDNPNRILASIKLWQFYRSQASLAFDDNTAENYRDHALAAAENLQHHYSQSPTDDIEAPILITLINAKSLYGSEQYESCFKLLQQNFLRNSKYTAFLYLYGKYIIKSNTKLKYVNTEEQKQFMGSGLGALEECLRTCVPEFQSRVNYYIGLAYNRQDGILTTPLTSIPYWHQSKNQDFNQPYQGLRKVRQISRFLDQYAFVQLIVDMINQSFKSKNDENQITAAEKLVASQYLAVLTNFEDKVDAPSSLILKAYIYAYTLKNEDMAMQTFKKLLQNNPQIIRGYLEFWDYLNQIYKKKHAQMKTKLTKSKQTKSRPLHLEAMQEYKETMLILQEIKLTTQGALDCSNKSIQVSTSEWVRVRIMAAKTYLLEKKFNKAIHILTDLCFVIPPDMLKINEDRANLNLYHSYDERNNKVDLGGIRFCNQILAENEESDEEGAEYSRKETDAFKNRIFIDTAHEQQILKDFDPESQPNPSKNMTRNNNSIIPVQDQEEPLMTRQDTQNVDDQSNWNMSTFHHPETEAKSRMSMKSTYSQNPSNLEAIESRSSIPTGRIEYMADELVTPVKQIRDSSGVFQYAPVNTIGKQHSDESIMAWESSGKDRSHKNQFSLIRMSNRKRKESYAGLGHKLSLGKKPLSSDKKDAPKWSHQGLKEHNIQRAASISISQNILLRQGSNMNGINSPGAARRQSTFRGKKSFKKSGDTDCGLDIELDVEDVDDDKQGALFYKGSQQNFGEQSRSASGNGSQSQFDEQEYQNVQNMLKNKNNTLLDMPEGEEVQTETMFAVNSDIHFLYMIGKMCAKSGHNLFQGLQALNDFYLLKWHHGFDGPETQKEGQYDEKRFGPLDPQSFGSKDGGNRIKQCIKALLCIGEIYEKLDQPILAQKYYFKILEGRGLLSRYGCSKQVLAAEKASGKIFRDYIGSQIPRDLGRKDYVKVNINDQSDFLIRSAIDIEPQQILQDQTEASVIVERIVIDRNHFR